MLGFEFYQTRSGPFPKTAWGTWSRPLDYFDRGDGPATGLDDGTEG